VTYTLSPCSAAGAVTVGKYFPLVYRLPTAALIALYG